MSEEIGVNMTAKGDSVVFITTGKITRGVIIISGPIKSWHDEVTLRSFQMDFNVTLPLAGAVRAMNLHEPEGFFQQALEKMRPDLLPKPLGPRPPTGAPGGERNRPLR